MNRSTLAVTLLRGFETTVVIAVGVLLAVAVAIAVLELFLLIFESIHDGLSLESLSSLQEALQNVFGGVLLVLLGLELIDTLKIYFIDHQVRTEVILVVAMIAVGRHIIQIDFHDTGGLELMGTAALAVSLAVSYYLVKRARSSADELDFSTITNGRTRLAQGVAEQPHDTPANTRPSPGER
jgi:uncharacterized membrane protein (DUF373 family)